MLKRQVNTEFNPIQPFNTMFKKTQGNHLQNSIERAVFIETHTWREKLQKE